MKAWSLPLIIREMQTKPTRRYAHEDDYCKKTKTEQNNNKQKQKVTSVSRGVGKLGPADAPVFN